MNAHQQHSAVSERGGHVALIGLGNIGSPLVEMLTRLEAVKRLTLVDRDVYEEQNLRGQAILPGDVGRPKAFVQAERARQISPALHVEPIRASVEDVPLGLLRADVMLACLDSKYARQQVNQIAWRLGIPWVDAGVAADGLLARVNVYSPGEDQPCLECAWGDGDYRTLEVKRPCQAEGVETPTRAPAFLGSLAAALQAVECDKILAGDLKSAAVGRQVTFVAPSHQVLTMTFRRNPKCKFDHRTFHIQPFRCEPKNLSLRRFIKALGKEIGGKDRVQLHVDGKPFERRWRCACGHVKAVLGLAGRASASDRACPCCGASMASVGFAMLPSLCEAMLTTRELAKPLSVLGVLSGDIVVARTENRQYAFELVTA